MHNTGVGDGLVASATSKNTKTVTFHDCATRQLDRSPCNTAACLGIFQWSKIEYKPNGVYRVRVKRRLAVTVSFKALLAKSEHRFAECVETGWGKPPDRSSRTWSVSIQVDPCAQEQQICEEEQVEKCRPILPL